MMIKMKSHTFTREKNTVLRYLKMVFKIIVVLGTVKNKSKMFPLQGGRETMIILSKKFDCMHKIECVRA